MTITSAWSPDWVPVLGLIDEARRRLADATGDRSNGWDSTMVSSLPPSGTTTAQQLVWIACNTVFGAWDQITDQLSELVTGIATARGDTRFTVVTQDQAVRDLTGAARPSIDALVATITATATNLQSTLQRAALPPRPAGDVAAQEATLANVRTDMAMVLERADMPREQVGALAEILQRALSNGDALLTWFLVSSGWADMVLPEPWLVMEWNQEAAELVGRYRGNDDQGDARRLLDLVDAPGGLAGAVQSMQHSARQAILNLGGRR